MPDLFTVAQGLGGSFVATVRNPANGATITSYVGTEPLAGSISAGQGTVPLITLTPTWISGPLGTIAVSIAASSTTSLDVGRYVGNVHLADLSANLCAFYLDVTYGAGTTAVTTQTLTSYGSFADMLNRAPAIEKFQRPVDLAGFAQQRYEARAWFEDILQRHFRDFRHRDGRRSNWLQKQLDANALVVTRPVVEAVTCYAIALIYDRQSMTVADGASFAANARKFFQRAEDTASLITAEVATTHGPHVVIRLGLTDTLEG